MSGPDAVEMALVLTDGSSEQIASLDLRPSRVVRALGNDALYFVAERCMSEGMTEEALLLFEASAKKSGALARLSAIRLTEIGDESKRNSAAYDFYKKYKSDAKAALVYAESLYNQKKYKKALSLVERALKNLNNSDSGDRFDYISDYNKTALLNGLTKVRLLCLLQEKKDDLFFQDVTNWFSNNAISDEHRHFYSGLTKVAGRSRLRTSHGIEWIQLNDLIKVRSDSAGRIYSRAYKVFANSGIRLQDLSAIEISDIGKSYLYGSDKFEINAQLFEKAAGFIDDEQSLFMLYFYAGRLHDRAGNNDSALQNFEAAMDVSPTSTNYDNALWYYLNSIAKSSIRDVIPALQKYFQIWNDNGYFDDFLDTTAYTLLEQKLWDDFVAAAQVVVANGVGESVGKYGYIAARLIEEGLAKNPTPHASTESVVKSFLEIAYSTYQRNAHYRFLAAARLGLRSSTTNRTLFTRLGSPIDTDNTLEALLLGYERYGVYNKLYNVFMEHKDKVSVSTAVSISKSLAKAGLPSKSLRVAAALAGRDDTPLNKEILQLLYPRPYLDEIHTAVERFDNNEALMYALIRSESFFDKDVISHAGAMGLSQLMAPTAEDVASRLRFDEYDVFDAKTNALFGSYYLSNMLRVFDQIPTLALSAYNAGLTNVRRWQKSDGNLPYDLFLEVIPFAETREYGRKVLSAAGFYGYLYYDQDVQSTVDYIMQIQP